ncbi:XRE family transcriptional regulator [Desulfosporosinus sp. Tol-M]|nr:XRE family transcriptional regulator [Desulfosporosinus sp. Tol-M]
MSDDLFYRRLTQLRMAKGVSARDMSLSLGQGPGYINNIENRKGLPSMTVFFYICEYLGVSPKEFFDDGNLYPTQMRELIEDLHALDEEQLTNIQFIVKGLKKQKLQNFS